MLPTEELFVYVYLLIHDLVLARAVVVPGRPGPVPAGRDAELLAIAVVRPPPAPVVLGRVHGDPLVQLDYFPVAPGGGSGLDSGDPAGCIWLCDSQLEDTAGPAAGRMWGFCGDLEDRGGDCAIFTSSLPAF